MKFLHVLFLIIFYAQNSFATAKLDSDQPIEIAADTLEVRQEDRIAIFTGNVEAIQGNIRLKASEMTVSYGEGETEGAFGEVSHIKVNGDVVLTTPDESAKSDSGHYNVRKEQITLQGHVVLARGKNLLRGDHLIYNLKTQKSLLTADKNKNADKAATKSSGGRVKGVFVPKQ